MEFITFLKLLPQLYKLAKIAHARLKQGATILEINRSLERVNEAFGKRNRAEGAAMLDDLWMRSNDEKTKD